MNSTRLLFLILTLSATASFAQSDQPANAVVTAPGPSAAALQLKHAARASFGQSDPAKAGGHLTALLNLYRQNVGDDRHQWRRHLAEIAREYLRGGELETALALLGEAADLDLPTDERLDDGLASAAAGLNRRLAALSADRRFELLHAWSMPTESRRKIRVLTSLVPEEAPPKVFAQALGERPRDNSFPVSEINGVHGLFSTAWLLVASASECGRLSRLTNELKQLAAEVVPNADYVLTLVDILREESNEVLTDQLSNQAARFDAGVPKPQDGPSQIDAKDLVTAAACLGNESLAPLGERMLESLVETTYGRESLRMRAFMRVAHATAVRNRFADSSSDILNNPQLSLWRSSQTMTARLSAMGSVSAMWLAHEDHVLHLAGPNNSLLYFRYPLTGEFEFSLETQDGGRRGTEGGVEYGGLGFEDLVNVVQRPSPFVPDTGYERFHRLAIKSTDSGFTVLSNGHPVWNDASGNRASPWIGLRSFGDRRPVFRNFKLTGNPTIPREVRMSEGDVLRGWRAGYFGGRLPSPFSATNPQTLSSDGWYLQDGIIHGVQQADGEGVQTRLEYAHPLCEGETVSYEFRYQPGQLEVHPALGRLAFLIEPAGVRIHWMADGEQEWTGLPEDNAVAEPLNRRGPKPLALVADDWNRVSIALTGDTITLSLNEAAIYQCKMEPGARTFGFFRNQATSAQIRNVVIRGDWPERLSDEQLTNLIAISADRTTAERHALHALFEEPTLAANVFEVRRRASTLAKEARLQYLLDWVLPGKDHPGFRIAGDFTPTNPPPSADGGPAGVDVRPHEVGDNWGSRVQRGGDLVSPAFDLIDLARELRTLDKLRARIEQAETDASDAQQERARIALLYLLAIAGDDEAAAQAHFVRLFDLFRQSGHYQVFDRWPEMLAMSRGIHDPATRTLVAELMHLQRDMYESDERGWKSSGWPNWDRHFFSLLGRLERDDTRLDTSVAASDRFAAAPRLMNWSPVSYATSKTQGEGYPLPHWQAGDKQVDKLSGHEYDYLMYRIPLRGNYEVECDLTPFSWRDTQLMVAGTWVAPYWDRTTYELGSFREPQSRRAMQPKLEHIDEFAHLRAVVRDGNCTTFINGRKIHQQPLPDEPEPWLAIRSWARHHGAVRDLRIAGEPIIPQQLNLAAAAGLPGWIPYFEDTVRPRGDWWHDGHDGIFGARKPELAGSWRESLLRYCRPMLEDGSIEYEFYYLPGRAGVHPALDRLAFLLEPEGVRVHWVTDGKYDRSGADPANHFTEPDNRRGSERLPLRATAWNRLGLTLRGDTVSLELNGLLVYQRVLESTNQRTFGLFHYADQTEMRVRNIVWRGDWPRELPALIEQELADDPSFLDKRLPELTAAFERDFAGGGLPDKYFRTRGDDVQQHITVEPDGVRVLLPSGEEWVNAVIQPRLRARGDFDIIAAFEQLEMSAERQDAQNPSWAGITFLAALAGQGEPHCKVIRQEEQDDRHLLVDLFAVTQPNGARPEVSSGRISEADSGRFRVARRGDQIYFLFAEGDSPMFRLLATQTATTEDTGIEGLQLEAAARGTGRVSVVWKSLSVRAEQLAHTADTDTHVLFVMNADGSEVKQLTKTIGNLGSHGSPDWSPDGKQVAFDTYSDSAAAHIYLVKLDGSGLTDLGLGSMPTFSADGKRIAFTWSGRGIAVMDVNGENRQIFDPSGWGAQWSPDGKSITYGGQNITLLDPATKRKRTILTGEPAKRYSLIYWNMSWSRDSSRICFLGKTRIGGKYEIAITAATGSANGFQVLHASESEPHPDFSWHPDGKQILCAMHDPERGGQRLFTLDAGQAAPPQLLPTQPLNQNSNSPHWSPDGKYIVFSSQPPTEWKQFQARVSESHTEK